MGASGRPYPSRGRATRGCVARTGRGNDARCDRTGVPFSVQWINTVHHVFFADVAHQATAQPSNEIARCKWFVPIKIKTLSTSVPTQGIVELFFRHMAAVEHNDSQRMLERTGDVTV